MKKTSLALGLALMVLPRAEAAALRVVATLPELVDIAKRVGGDLVAVDGLARGVEDIHQIVMKPSFVAKLNRADAVVFLGLTAEHTFLPGLLDAAQNPALRVDHNTSACLGPGCIDCSAGVRILDKPQSLSRAQGEVHAQGNPHYNLDPRNGLIIARNIEAGFSRLDPGHAAQYKKNLAAYREELELKIAQWVKKSGPLKGLKAVSYHGDVAYLAAFTGLDFIGTIEPKPGIAPTPAHLAALVGVMKDAGAGLIVREQQYDAKTPAWLAEKTGAKIAVIGTMANSMPDTETFVKFSEKNLINLLEAR
ncbi:MAG: metal ABC transporter substrate-binding protein [Elusimicrobiota bacterium]